MSAWEEGNNYQVDEIDTELEYEVVEGILRQQSVLKYASNNIQAIMACIKTISVKANETVIEQGDNGNDYYIISKGRCQVIQKKEHCNRPQVIAELREGDAFGEEALIAESTRNASIVMMEDGMLLKLNRKDFSQFLMPSLISYVGIKQCNQLIKNGAQWIDCRSPSEHETNGLGINVPLSSIRILAHELDRNNTYIVYCDDGKKSAVAAFILKQLGVNALVLEGGLNKYLQTTPHSLLPLKKDNLYKLHTEPREGQNAFSAEKENAHQDDDKTDINHYQDLLIELTLKNQKEIRSLKASHQNELKKILEQRARPPQPVITNKDLHRRIASLENNLEKKKKEVKELTEKVNSFDVKAISHQQIINAYNEFVQEQTSAQLEFQKREEALTKQLAQKESALKIMEQELAEKNNLIAGLEQELLQLSH